MGGRKRNVGEAVYRIHAGDFLHFIAGRVLDDAKSVDPQEGEIQLSGDPYRVLKASP